MPILIVQADDNAMSPGTALGVMEAIRHGVVRNTGMFSNMPAAASTARMLADAPGVCVGLDVNFVTGRPVSALHVVPDLVGDDGAFRSSGAVRRANRAISQAGMITTFESEPFPYEQVMDEGRAQVDRFVELVGRPPAYLHHHAIATPTTDRVVTDLAAELDVPVPLQMMAEGRAYSVPNQWYRSPFPLEEQASSDPLADVLSSLTSVARHEVSILITHPGYVDAELLDLSSFSVIRPRDLQMLCDPRLRDALEALSISPGTYDDL